jgi:Tfp pilus assembly PilM family ATPase
MKVLSFDIGSSSIKAVALDASFGRIELSDYWIEKVVEEPKLGEIAKPAASPENESTGSAESKEKSETEPLPPRQLLTPGQVKAIKKILGERHFQYDRLVVSFPKTWATNRIFQFPTKDRKTIQSSLSFELDDDIPFQMTDVVYDFAQTQTEGQQNTVFVSVALKSDIANFLSELQMLGLDPEMITIEGWAMGHLFKRVIPAEYQGRPICVVNIGHAQTAVHMLVGESPVFTHVSTCAGADITRAIAQAYNLSFDDAERAKVEGSFLLTQAHLSGAIVGETITSEQKAFSATVADALIPMIREIKQTLMAHKSLYKTFPRAIFITGGTSLIPNLPLFLEEHFRIPVFPLTYISKLVGQTLQLSEMSETVLSSATGYSLSAVKTDRNSTINFRKDTFAKSGGLGAIDWKSYKRPLKYIALSLAFVYMNLIAQSMVLSRRSASQDAQLEHAIKSVLGATSPSTLSSYKSSPSILKSAVAKEIAKYKESSAVSPSKAVVSAFDVLNKTSTNMPRDMVLDVSLFELKDGKLRMAGVVDKITAPERIAKALEDTKLLTDVTKQKAEEDPKTKKVKFEIVGKLAEAGHGTSTTTNNPAGNSNVKNR